ncbi:MAG: MBOAT family protein, partial [Bdellovibrionales bacterium]|nr:MBOAT family protein [Bdellovibrionales bacterium]
PIIRYHDIAAQIERRTLSLDETFYGMYRFAIGLGKKVLIADTLGQVSSNVVAVPFEDLSMPYAWLGILAYSFQIYFDFAGYSDMAIGLGHMMGFRFLENFNLPYISRNVTEFWRRWHISLSNWMKEYLYIPLGGNRVSPLRTYINLWTVFFLSGLWHGANWTFIVWGLLHGLYLVCDRLFWVKLSGRLPKAFNIIWTFLLVTVAWVFFRAPNIDVALLTLREMFSVSDISFTLPNHARGDILHNRAAAVFALAILMSFLPAIDPLVRIYRRMRERSGELVVAVVRFALIIPCVLLSAIALAATDFHPFLYFRF